MRLQPCLDKSPHFTTDEKNQIRDEVKAAIEEGVKPDVAAHAVIGNLHLKPLRDERAKVAGTIFRYRKDLVSRAKAAGKPVYEPPKIEAPGPETGPLEVPAAPSKVARQAALPGITNPVFTGILSMRVTPTEDILLNQLSRDEFMALNTVMGFPVSGTLAQKAERFMQLYGLRKQLQDYAATFEGAKAYQAEYKKTELVDQARMAKIWRSGNKQQLAGALLGWRDRVRAKGLKATIAAYEEAGAPVPKIFTEALETKLGTIGAEKSELGAWKEELLTDRAKESRDLANWVVDKIENQEVIGWRDLFEQANKDFGGTQAEGVYTPKDAYDAMELGINRYILKNVRLTTPQGERKAPETIIKQLKAIGDFLPTQTKRTQEQEEFQQFSTPPFLSFAANDVANIQTGDTYAEPSAGIGGLAIFGKMAGAENVYVNEFSKRRLDLLRVLDFDGYFNEDAAQLDNVLRGDINPTVIVMNPPFSSTAGRLKRNMTTYGAKHIEQALKRLQPGGRLVAIVGKGMEPQAPTFRKWWKDISKKYDVRANIGISGEEYRKYGTTFDNRLIVIDKIAPKQYLPIVADVKTVDELPALLKDIRNDRPEILKPDEAGEPETIQPARPETLETVEGAPPTGPTARLLPTDLAPGEEEDQAGQRVPGEPPELPPGPTAEPGEPLPVPGEPGAPGQPPGPGAGPVRGTERGPIGELGGVPAQETPELSLDQLNSLIDEVALEENLEVGARPEKETGQPRPKPTRAAAPEKSPLESDFDDLADIINSLKVEEPIETYKTALLNPAAYEKAKPILAKTYNDFVAAWKGSGEKFEPKEWIRTVLTGLAQRNVDPEIAKNWIVHFYVVDRPSLEPARGAGKKEAKRVAIGKAKRKISELKDKLYERYQALVNIKGAKKHPTVLDESAALADTTPPPPTYEPSLPREMIESGKISDAQLEANVYAGQAHEQILPNGDRKGFFAGHGTGVGKGRIIASIILDNWSKGRKKAVWVSQTGKLMKDAKRDLGYDADRKSESGIGWKEGVDKIFTLGPKHKLGVAGSKFPEKEGILFTTYGTLRSNFKKINLNEAESLKDMRVRINQMVDWLGEDFDGVIAFDESHNMANAIEQRGSRGMKKASDQALAGILLQQRLPKARIVYVSATGATEVSNFAYAERLGLWGEGTAFPSKASFIDDITGAGLAGMELVARDLKSMGLYLAPTLSYDGVSYDRLVHELDPQQEAKYDELAKAWQVVLNNIREALGETNQDQSGQAKKNIWSQFWGGHQRFFNQVITTMQMGNAIKHIEEKIEAGNSIVLQLVNHGGAQLERVTAAREEGQELEDLDFTPRQALMSYIENSFPVAQYEEYTDEDGNQSVRPMYDSQGNPVLNREAVRMREEMLMKIGSISIPNSPLDLILEHFGTDQVAEVTGRKRRIVMDRDTGRLVEEKWSDAKANSDAEAFMQDEKRILVFSEKGGTGNSYHADLDTDNHRIRSHYLIQPGWRADRAIQGLGRTHRSNQAQAPEYFLVTTNLKAQKRFISSIARRLDQLGALTKGQRQTGSQGIFQARDNLESEYARIGLYQLYRDIVSGEADITLDEFEEQTALRLTDSEGAMLMDLPPPQKFMNRLLSMTIENQNKIFDEWSGRIDAVIDAAAAAGTLDIGIETIRGIGINKVEDKVVNTDEDTGAETRYVKLEVENPGNRIPYEDIVADKFYRNITSGKIWGASMLRTGTDKSGNVYEYRTLTSPAGSQQRIKTADIFQAGEKPKWEEVTSKKEAQREWEAGYKQAPATLTRDVHIMTGALLPIWDRLAGSATVYRMQTDEGERILGRVIHQNKIDEVLENLGVTGKAVDLDGTELSKRILDQGAKIRLVNGWRMKKVQVSGEERIELFGPNFDHWNELKKNGVIIEKINYKTRYFVPTGAKSGDTIDAITKYKPVAMVEMPYSGPTLQDTVLNEPLDIKDLYGNVKEVQLQLFGEDKALFTDKPKAKKIPGPRQVVLMQKTSDLSHYGTKVRNSQEAAGLVSHIRGMAAEEVYTIATDKNGDVIQVHFVSKGTATSSSVNAVETGGAFLRAPGIKKLYFIHQHPSGSVEPSPADRLGLLNLFNIGRLRGIDVRGVILARDNYVTYDPFGTANDITRPLTEEIKRRTEKTLNTKIPVTQRVIRPERGYELSAGLPQLTDSKTARELLKKAYNDMEGFLLMDARFLDLGFLPWPKKTQMKEVTAQLIAEAERLNAASFLINWKPGGRLPKGRMNFIKGLARDVHPTLYLAEVLVDDVSMADSGTLGEIKKKQAARGFGALNDLVKDDILFSRKVAAPEVSMTREQVQQTIDPFIAEMKTRPPVTVVRTQDGLPPGILDFLRSTGGGNDIITAAYHNGRVYMVAENIESPQEALRALFHEVMGHFGIHSVLGDRLDKMMDSVYIAKRGEVEAIATEYGYNLRTKEGRRSAADEWLAREAEVNPNSTWIDRIVAMVRAWIRKINPKLALSDAEIRYLLARARQYVGSGAKTTVFPGTVFDRIPEMADIWYSQMEMYLDEKLPASGTAASYMEMINGAVRGGKIKKEELAWSGLPEWLAHRKGSIPKAHVMGYLRDNNVKLEETVKTDIADTLGDDTSDITWEVQPDGESMWGEFYNPHTQEVIEIQVEPAYGGGEGLTIAGEDYGTFVNQDAAMNQAQNEISQLMATWEGIEDMQFQPTAPPPPQGGFVFSDGWLNDDIYEISDIPNLNDVTWTIDPSEDQYGMYVITRKEFDDGGIISTDEIMDNIESHEIARGHVVEMAQEFLNINTNINITPPGPLYPTRHSTLQEPGGKNYRELLIRIPVRTKPVPAIEALIAEYDDWTNAQKLPAMSADELIMEQDLINPQQEAYLDDFIRRWDLASRPDFIKRSRVKLVEEESNEYTGQRVVQIYLDGDWKATKSGTRLTDEQIKSQFIEDYLEQQQSTETDVFQLKAHWQEDNVLAHVRFNERMDKDGNKIVFMEEIQTDIGKQIHDLEKKIRTPEATSADHKYLAKLKRITPFPKNGRLLAFKRMVRWAAENDFDKIAWTTGQMQKDRYDLTKLARAIEVSQMEDGTWSLSIEKAEGGWFEDRPEWENLTDEKLGDQIGKDLAKKIINKEGEEIAHQSWRYEGVDLQVGGEGLGQIYDKILPNEINKFFNKKKWGKPKVEPITLATAEAPETQYDYAVVNAAGDYRYHLAETKEAAEAWAKANRLIYPGIRVAPNETWYVLDVYGVAEGVEDTGTPREFATQEAAHRFLLDQYNGNGSVAQEKERPADQVLSLPITSQMRAQALYKGMPMFQRKRQGDIDIVGRLPEEVKHRFAQARGVPKTPWKERAKEKIEYMRRLRHHFPGLAKLPNVTQQAQLADMLRQHQEVPETAKDKAVRWITRFTKHLTQSEYEIFRTNVILDDMMRDVDEGLLSDQMLGEGETLPFGFESVQQLKQTKEVFDQLANENPAVRKSINDRRQMINKMVRQMVKFKILKKEVLRHKDYFHHQVLAFWAGNKMKTAGASSADVRTHWRPWMAARKGSLMDYNTEYVEAEFAALAQQMAQLETAKTLEKVKRNADLYRELKTAAKQENIERFYVQAAKQASAMFGADISPAEVRSDHKLDPLFGYRQNIAMATQGLRKMAINDKFDHDSEWDDVVQALAEEAELSKMGLEEDAVGFAERHRISDGRYFAFLSYLIEKQKPGAMWAATTFKAIHGRNRHIKEALGPNFVTFRQLIPEGYQIWKPDPGKGWFWANTIADNIVQKIIEGEKALEDRDVRQILAKGQDLVWVIPEGLAETLDTFRTYPEPNSLGRVADWALRAWKQWVLINPRRWIKYNTNNMSGDLDITLAYAPAIASPDKMVKALSDLRKWHKRADLPPETQAEIDNARKKGVIGSGFAVQEVEDVLNIMSMDKWVREVLLGEKPNLAMRYWEAAKGSTVIRENMLRLAAYRWFRKQVAAGNKVYGASKVAEIDAIEDPDDKAAKLARELIGDYGNISQAGQYIRQRLIPFYSWMEINLPRYVYLMRNLRSEDRHFDKAAIRKRMAGVVAKRTVTGAAKLAIKANLLMGAVLLWNLLAHRDEWEEMGESKRRQLHLIVGRNDDGTISTIRFQGALSDALSFFGLEDWPADIQDIRTGKGSLQEKMADVPVALATRAIHGVRPEPKLLFEALTKETTYPDPFSPRAIRDTTEHILRTFSLDSIYRQATGKPGRGKTKAQHFLNDVKNLLIYDSDPGEQAYYDTRKMVFDYLDENEIERGSGKPTNRSNALYYYRQALKYGDFNAAKRYLDKYYDLGGSPRSLRTSIKRSHPLGSLAMKYRFRFRQSLTPAEQKRLKMAMEWYDRIYKGKDLEIRMEVAKERYGRQR